MRHAPDKLCFDAYEADLRAGELRKHGFRIPLEDRPFRALVILLQHANLVVTREELQAQLWPSDVFIDFNQGLNAAIGKIRRALNDSPEKPRFIETLGRRGYRFIGQVSAEPLESATETTGLPPVESERGVHRFHCPRFPAPAPPAFLFLAPPTHRIHS